VVPLYTHTGAVVDAVVETEVGCVVEEVVVLAIKKVCVNCEIFSVNHVRYYTFGIYKVVIRIVGSKRTYSCKKYKDITKWVVHNYVIFTK
jgi:hypothetical protein